MCEVGPHNTQFLSFCDLCFVGLISDFCWMFGVCYCCWLGCSCTRRANFPWPRPLGIRCHSELVCCLLFVLICICVIAVSIANKHKIQTRTGIAMALWWSLRPFRFRFWRRSWNSLKFQFNHVNLLIVVFRFANLVCLFYVCLFCLWPRWRRV